jgi:F-type H+-transporting ATPase subunit alpha
MNVPPESMLNQFDRAFIGMSRAREIFKPEFKSREIGVITSVFTGIATVSGLPDVGFDELIKFPGDLFGIAFNLDENEIGVVLLGDYSRLRAGDEVERTGRVMDVAVGDELIGRVIDPLGRPLDGKNLITAVKRLPIVRRSRFHCKPASKLLMR